MKEIKRAWIILKSEIHSLRKMLQSNKYRGEACEVRTERSPAPARPPLFAQ